MENVQTTHIARRTLDRTRYYMGGYWVFLATGRETGGKFALIEMNMRKGLEPPQHTHTFEDESFHLLEGEVQFTVNGEEHLLRAGEFLHIPKGVTHSLKLQTDTAKVITHLAPAGLENFFMELSRPADQMDYPPLPAGPPPAEWLQKAAALQKEYGIVGMDNNKIKG
jgi:quercetin dioxygenase-like cupin family protein